MAYRKIIGYRTVYIETSYITPEVVYPLVSLGTRTAKVDDPHDRYPFDILITGACPHLDDLGVWIPVYSNKGN